MRAVSFLLCSLLLLAGGTSQAQAQRGLRLKDTIAVFFPLDVRALTGAATHKLDSLRYREVLTPDKDLYLIGYADYVGRSSYNDSLSLSRAQAVKTHLLSLGFKDHRIRLVTGRGEVRGRDSTGRDGWAADRRVDIALAPPGFGVAPQRRRDTLRQPMLADGRQSLLVERLADVPKDSVLVLNNLYFPHGRHYVYPRSFPVLDALVATLAENSSLRVRVEGHVCCIDPRMASDAIDEDTGEFALSVNRAKYIVEYLVGKGIARERLTYVGFGKSKPVVVPERSSTDTEKNRRVEIRVLAR